MKRILTTAALLLSATAAVAQTTGGSSMISPGKLEQLVRDSLPACQDLKLTPSDLEPPLPNFHATMFKAESKGGYCDGQYVAVVSPTGGFYFNMPWFLSPEKMSVEDKLKDFMWQSMHQNATATVGTTRTADGLLPATIYSVSEQGKTPLEGEVDPLGRVFFLGHFKRPNSDIRSARIDNLKPVLANAPAKGPADAAVTVVEFSDFQCPSCKHASEYMTPVMAKHADKVRYVRYDLPLVNNHPWAFGAAMAGRAIYRQKPEAFWDYKKAIYENQDKLSAFTLEDFARGFAQDHDLDMKRYDADVNSQEIRNELLRGVGLAFSNDVSMTPTYLVNGRAVDPGQDGGQLLATVESLLGQTASK